MTGRAEWMALLPVLTGDPPLCPACPCCGREATLRTRYVVDRGTRVGYLLMWCDACLRGISISRVQAPEGAEARWFDDSDALAGVPEFTRCE